MLVSAITAEASGSFLPYREEEGERQSRSDCTGRLELGKAECPVLQGSFRSGLQARQLAGNLGCDRSNFPMSALDQRWWSCFSAKPSSAFFWLPALKGLFVRVQVVSVLVPLELGQPSPALL